MSRDQNIQRSRANSRGVWSRRDFLRKSALAAWASLVSGGKNPEERWKRITTRHLLQHTGGWDRDKSFDPMFRPREISRTLGVASPPGPRDILRYRLGQPFEFDPGTRYAYSNFGYCVLGRVIEKVTGVN